MLRSTIIFQARAKFESFEWNMFVFPPFAVRPISSAMSSVNLSEGEGKKSKINKIYDNNINRQLTHKTVQSSMITAKLSLVPKTKRKGKTIVSIFFFLFFFFLKNYLEK